VEVKIADPGPGQPPASLARKDRDA
jgi:hypothetical protein